MPTYDRVHLSSCLARAVVSAVENLRDDAAVSHLMFHQVVNGGEYQGLTLYAMAYTYLEDGLVSCICGAMVARHVNAALNEVALRSHASATEPLPVEPEMNSDGSGDPAKVLLWFPDASDLSEHTGKWITDMQPMPESMYDRDETGPMYLIRLDGDGTIYHAYESEIQEEAGATASTEWDRLDYVQETHEMAGYLVQVLETTLAVPDETTRLAKSLRERIALRVADLMGEG